MTHLLSKLLLTPSHTKDTIYHSKVRMCRSCAKKVGDTSSKQSERVYKGKSASIGGRDQLNEKIISSMQNFYGIAIHQNLNHKY